MYCCKYTSLLTGGSWTQKNERPGAWTGNGRFVKRFLKGIGAFKTSYDAFREHNLRAPDYFCFKIKSYDFNDDRPDAVRCLAGHRMMSAKRQ